MSTYRRHTHRGSIAALVLVFVTGCGTQSPPGGSATPQATKTSTTPVASPKTAAKAPKSPETRFDQATSDMIPAVDAAALAHYSDTYGMVSYNLSQVGMMLRMTDLAQGRKLIAGVLAGHPEWAGVPVTLIRAPYTGKRLQAAQNAVPEGFYRKYQLVSVGQENCVYLSVLTSDSHLKGPAGSAGRQRLAGVLQRTVGVDVRVAWSQPASAAAG